MADEVGRRDPSDSPSSTPADTPAPSTETPMTPSELRYPKLSPEAKERVLRNLKAYLELNREVLELEKAERLRSERQNGEGQFLVADTGLGAL